VTWRPAASEHRPLAFLWSLTALATPALLPWIAGAASHVPCLFRSLTGLSCPTCGGTRAAQALLAGRPLEAFLHNPALVLAGGLLVAGGLLAPIWVRLRGPVPDLGQPLPLAVRGLALAILAANWGWVILRSS
jgi:hypothetical protein